jgi:isopenicillin-N epimerase
MQHLIEPLVVGWGWGTQQRQFASGSDFLDYHEWLGTYDPSAYLAVPKAIHFQRRHDWPSVRQRCHDLAVYFVDEASRIPGIQRLHANEHFHQMALIELTRGGDPAVLKSQLDDRRIEVPVIRWNDRLLVRVSVQAYNTLSDVDKLRDALRDIVT